MAKTFIQLTCMNTIYRITKNKELLRSGRKGTYEYHDGIVYHEIPVVNLESVTEGNESFLIVNAREEKDSWGGKKKVWLLKLDLKQANTSSVETEYYIYFVNKHEGDSLLREMALKEISRFMREAKEYTEARMKDIEEVRKNYFRVLNNKSND